MSGKALFVHCSTPHPRDTNTHHNAFKLFGTSYLETVAGFCQDWFNVGGIGRKSCHFGESVGANVSVTYDGYSALPRRGLWSEESDER